MKRLFLTSAGLPPETTGEFLRLLKKDPKDARVCFITTASDPEEDKSFVEKDKARLLELGFRVTDVDLKKESKDSLTRKLERFDVVYVEGGNTFYLLKHSRESGFREAIDRFLKAKGIYVGVSAGTIIAGPNIDPAGWKHADRNDVGLKDLTALGLVPFVISVHTDENNLNAVKSCANKVDYPVVAITDKQAILVDGDRKRIVGGGKKHVFNMPNRL